MEAQYGKFLDMIRVVRINVPLVDVLAGILNYGKFLKDLVSNKHKLEKISSTILSDENSAIIQNKVPPKLGDPGSFFIPCTFSKTFSCNTLADLGASINLMPYSLYAKLSLETLKPTKMSIRLADRSFQYPIGIAENMLVEINLKIVQAQKYSKYKYLRLTEVKKCTALSAVKRFFLKTFSKVNISLWMHICASNSELVEPLSELERTLNRRVRRRNKRVPFERRNERPRNPRVIYPPVLDINHFRHFLNFLENHNPMDDEPMWATDRVVAPTLGPIITIPEIANEFAIKGNHLTLIKGNQFDGRIKTNPHKHVHEVLEMLRNCHGHNLTKGNIIKIFYHGLNETTQEALNAAADGIFLYKTPNQAFQLLEDKVLLKLDWAKNQKSKIFACKTVAFADEGSNNVDTDKIIARMDAMTMKMDAQYKEIQSCTKCNHYGGNNSTTYCNDDDTPMSREEEAKFM
ncbi:reverse transcriptase domain-containing protein [Tanacetum coccineum]